MKNQENILENFEFVNNELADYIWELIQYHYNLNDKGHDINHVKYVIERSLKFANKVENINMEMVFVIASYHDIAHHIDAKNHEILSAKMLIEDTKLRRFFSEEQIKIMSEAVEDHRSSLETKPRTIYGEIVSSADRNTSVETTLKRCYSYNKKHFPNLNERDLIEKCRKFLLDKFGINGYARNKMYFYDEEYERYLENITKLASNYEEFYKEIKNVNAVN